MFKCLMIAAISDAPQFLAKAETMLVEIMLICDLIVNWTHQMLGIKGKKTKNHVGFYVTNLK